MKYGGLFDNLTCHGNSENLAFSPPMILLLNCLKMIHLNKQNVVCLSVVSHIQLVCLLSDLREGSLEKRKECFLSGIAIKSGERGHSQN